MEPTACVQAPFDDGGKKIRYLKWYEIPTLKLPEKPFAPFTAHTKRITMEKACEEACCTEDVSILKRKRNDEASCLTPIESIGGTTPKRPGWTQTLNAIRTVALWHPEAAAVLRGVHPALRGDPELTKLAEEGQLALLETTLPLVQLSLPHIQPESDWLVCPRMGRYLREGEVAARTASVSMFKYLRFYPEDPWGFFSD